MHVCAGLQALVHLLVQPVAQLDALPVVAQHSVLRYLCTSLVKFEAFFTELLKKLGPDHHDTMYT